MKSQCLVFHQALPISLIGVCLFSDDLQARMPMIAMVERYGEVPAIPTFRLSQKRQSRLAEDKRGGMSLIKSMMQAAITS